MQDSIADLNLRTLMCVPLTARGETFGVLYVDSQAVVTTFTRKDLDLLRAIASHAGLAIANASLYAESLRQREELAQALDRYREAEGPLEKVIPAVKPKPTPRKTSKKE